MRYPRLRYHDKDGLLGASDALAMCFYMRHPNERLAPAVVRAVELFRERILPYRISSGTIREMGKPSRSMMLPGKGPAGKRWIQGPGGLAP